MGLALLEEHWKAGRSLSVIDSLSAGFRFLGWRLELLVIPVALDLLLWLAPQFSIAPMTSELATWYRQMSAIEEMPPDMAIMTQQVADGLESLGANFNLLSSLVSTTLLHVPSLLISGVQPSSLPGIEITTPGEALLFWLVLSLLGLLLGVTYLGLAARHLPIGAMSGLSGRVFIGALIRQWLQVIAFILLVALLLLVIYVPLSVAISLLALLSPAFGSFLAVASGGLSLIIFFYLYFATAGIVMDNLSALEAIKRSVQVVRANFFATLGFAVLSTLIGLGISLLLLRMANTALWVVTPAILLNAYVGTGLAMALLIFYRTRYISSEAEIVR